MFLTRVEAAVSVMHVEAAIKKILNKFFNEYKLPMPKIKIVNSLTSRWLGRTSYTKGDYTTTIEVQKSITDDEKTLDRILTHELIHHWEFLVLAYDGADTSISLINHARTKYKMESHGKAFFDWCRKINASMGKDYVSEKSDSTYVLSLDKEFYILIAPTQTYKGRYGWCWAVRPSAAQWTLIKWRQEHSQAKLFKTHDARYLAGARLSKKSGLSVPLTGTEEGKIMDNFLTELYTKGKEITF